MVTVQWPSKDPIELAPYYIWTEELRREILQNIKGKNKEILQQHECQSQRIKSPTVFLNLFMLYYYHMKCHQGIMSVPGGDTI